MTDPAETFPISARFERRRLIGAGAFGAVYEAFDRERQATVALKTLHRLDAVALSALKHEFRALAGVRHPNIVRLYELLSDGGGWFLTMELVDGCDFRAYVRGGPNGDVPTVIAPDANGEIGLAETVDAALALPVERPTEARLRSAMKQLAEGLAALHERGILHRDLKPSNVLVSREGRVVIVDFGLVVEAPRGKDAFIGPIAGTPAYMAPEMLLGAGDKLSPRTDVYLLGAIFYEICAGQPPHEGATVEAMFSSVLLSQPRFPPNFPVEARGICQRALSRDPADRYESAGALRAAIEGYLRHRGSRRLAWEAKRSLTRLLHAIEHEPPGEDRTLAVFNLLGECRFGYRAALSAWPENEAARRDLDRALIAVIEHELAGGDPTAAATLLREVAAPPPDLAARVEAASRARAEQDERLRRLELDHDPRVGTRTRTLLGGIYGVSWTLLPLYGWWRVGSGMAPSHEVMMAISAVLLLLGLLLFAWARETLTKTRFNRRIAGTLGLQLGWQILLAAGASLAGVSPLHGLVLLVLSWSLSMSLLAVWVERWFAVPAATSALAFLVSAARPNLVYAAITAQNIVFTTVLLRFWFPRDTLAKMMEQRDALRRRARRWLEDAYGGGDAPGDGEG